MEYGKGNISMWVCMTCDGAYLEIEMGICMYGYMVTHTYKHKGQDTHIQRENRRQEGIYICLGVNRIAHIHRFQDQDTRIQI